MEIIVNVVVPIITGTIFFGLAWYCAYIAPMRSLVTSELTYRAAFWGFIAFGIYLATRPFQVLLGPHPMPLIINNLREFFMIGFFGPGVFIALVNLSLCGERKIPIPMILAVFLFGITLAIVFCITNIFAIGGSVETFKIGNYTANDGKWFLELDDFRGRLMAVLFIIRVADPVLLLFIAGVFAIYRSVTLPKDMRQVYNNMQRKLAYAGISTLFFSLSMLSTGFMWLLGKIPNQWWLYYLGALAAGVFEVMSIALPFKHDVEV
ncbi:MAG: hypothetical protein WC955_01495 [Elusimicrobiota bacterium]